MRLERFRCVTRLVMAAAVAAVALFAGGGASAAKPGSTLATFNTPGAFAWTVPNGVKQVTFDLFGAQGGTGSDTAAGGVGGRGGETTAKLAVQAGQVFEVVVGGQGQPLGGSNGGG